MSDWLATTETMSSDIAFDGDRIFVKATSYAEPIDEQSMVQLMQAEFGEFDGLIWPRGDGAGSSGRGDTSLILRVAKTAVSRGERGAC